MELTLFVLIVGIAIALLPPEAEYVPDRVVLLPGADGRTGKVIVSSAAGSQEIATPYGALAVGESGALVTYAETPEAVQSRYGALLAARPPLPKSYLLYFKSGGDELTSESIEALNALKADVTQRVAPEILVIGHTDRVGTDSANDALSLLRAEAIAAKLREFGIRPLSLEVTGRGEREPLVPTADGVDEPLNRRVEISIR